ncbi:MAG: heavy metal translocating P-type ATPase [Rhizobiales bacterium]|nr:heavy metal translocating P-type ATPase [Hyphomicrobiales bacterium]NRB15295.1 heavy metal translocating P-type ATPase [Hyphomicrobiales bacterium]
MLACCPVDYALNDITEMRQSKGLDWASELVADPSPWVTYDDNGLAQLDILVPEVYCAACIGALESNFKKLKSVKYARLNLTRKRLSIRWDERLNTAHDMMVVLEWLGYHGQPFDASQFNHSLIDNQQKKLLTSLGVAGFAAANVMLLSVSIWSGADEATRNFFHWISALIALPALAYSGQVFFKSAFRALRVGSLNMDVPISLAIILALYISLSETIAGGAHAYFDAAITLVFFLLVGRYLDISMRQRAQSAAEQLMSMLATAATLILPDGSRKSINLNDVKLADHIFVAIGEKIPVDGKIIGGKSDLDNAFLTGESIPETVSIGQVIHAGGINLTGALTLEVTAVGKDTLLADIIRLMEQSERTAAKYVRLADRVAKLYAPIVHILAAVTLLGWMLVGKNFDDSLFIATSVLIITCPCALGLAVPAVQVVASGILLRLGILLKNGEALEKLADIDIVIFDKTGTLTMGQPKLTNGQHITDADIKIAASMAVNSQHPLSQAIVKAATNRGLKFSTNDNVQELVGQGLIDKRSNIKLGNQQFAAAALTNEASNTSGEFYLSVPGKLPIRFKFEDALRPDAKQVVDGFKQAGIDTMILSGDHPAAVKNIADKLQIKNWQASCTPQDKLNWVEQCHKNGKKTFVIGDGTNDAPALTAAYVSMSPGSANDVSQLSADLIFQSQSLKAVYKVWQVAKFSRGLIKQNIGLALGYNAIAVPFAILGFATPFFAAIAMSTSSMIVTLNALRLRLKENSLK